MIRQITAIIGVSLMLSGCFSYGPYGGGSGDGAPARRMDPNTIRDATPRAEPRSRSGNPQSYTVNGRRYHVMSSSQGYSERGLASWYGTKFHGRRTSSGEPYDMYAMTAAHKELPLPTYVRVTNLRNGRSAVVRVNDRGPFHENRIIDLSYAAATKLGILGNGTGLVEVTALNPNNPAPPPRQIRTFANRTPTLFIQVGAFASRNNAERLSYRLGNSLRQPIRIQQAGRIFRVQIGPLANVEQVDELSMHLPALGIHTTHVVIE
jgi:rare lipoprotein A